MNNETRPEKLPLRTKLFYSIGQFTDSIPFNIFYIYFLFFFIDVVGLSPAAGGTISLIIVLWDAVTDPVIGYLSDNRGGKYGRRRPFMLVSAIPLFICTVLLFTAVDFGPKLSFIYYLVVGIFFWTFYTGYVIPFFALGAELTQDYNDRNNLRSIAGVFIYVAVWIVTAGPMMVLDKVTAAGGTPQTAWMISAAIFGGIGLLSALVCWRFTRGKELHVPKKQEREKVNVIVNYFQLFKIKSFRRLLGMILFACVCFSVASAVSVYLMSNNLSLSASQQALYWTCNTLFTFVIIPIINFTANKINKKRAFALFMMISIALSVFFFFKGIESFSELLVSCFFYQLANVCFWTIGYSLTYDVCEVDEFINGKRREGSITGFASLFQKFGSAIGLWLSGVLLTAIGYDGLLEVQAESTIKGILALNTALPAFFYGIALVFLLLYPINQHNFKALLAALDKKRRGEAYTTDGFKELL